MKDNHSLIKLGLINHIKRGKKSLHRLKKIKIYKIYRIWFYAVLLIYANYLLFVLE